MQQQKFAEVIRYAKQKPLKQLSRTTEQAGKNSEVREQVRELMGHKSIAMTERYSHLSPDTLRKAFNSLESARNQHGFLLAKFAMCYIETEPSQ
jgi:hypothetical protein